MTVIGELTMTLGCIVLLFTGYELWGTDWTADRAQDQLSGALDRQWADPAGARTAAPVVGKAFAKLYIPAFGATWDRAVLEGVGQDVLADGPGHYPGTAAPGALGNLALAGHRVGHGAPFDDAGKLTSCDALVVETRTDWFVYRVLPAERERTNWAATGGARPTCRGVPVLGGAYAQTFGSEVVYPNQVDVVAPVPHRPGVAPTVSLLTITTCTPRFSARQRLIIHAVQTAHYAKADHRQAGWRPAELGEV